MLDFEKFARKHGVPYLTSGHHHCKEGWIQTNCPFCSAGRDGWHLGYAISSGAFNCWRCGRLRFLDVIKAFLPGCNPDRIRKAIGECQLHQTPEAVKPPVTRKRKLKPPLLTGPMMRAHEKYLESRGFDFNRLASEWNLMATGPISDPGWNWRLVIPIKEADGTIVAYQGRTIGEGTPKYRMTADEDCLDDPEGILYGMHALHGDRAIIVEGVTGCWNIGPGTIGMLGIDWKTKKADRLRRIKNRFILFDPTTDEKNERSAEKSAERLAMHLSLFPGNTEIIEGFGCDSGSMRKKDVFKLRRRLGLELLS